MANSVLLPDFQAQWPPQHSSCTVIQVTSIHRQMANRVYYPLTPYGVTPVQSNINGTKGPSSDNHDRKACCSPFSALLRVRRLVSSQFPLRHYVPLRRLKCFVQRINRSSLPDPMRNTRPRCKDKHAELSRSRHWLSLHERIGQSSHVAQGGS